MDIDPPPGLPNNVSTLKRSSSAPMINILGNSSFRDTGSPVSSLLLSIPRTRRFSASFSPGQLSPCPHSPSSSVPLVVPSRVSQIKHEEGMDVMIRETAHEKEVQSKLQMSQSWEDLTLDDTSLGECSKRPRSLTDPLHIFTPPLGLCNSPSPTRTGKQCFSPSMSMPVRSSFSPSLSPSPTRKTFATRRSQSPITLRPSQFSIKRKCDIDMEQDCFASPAKRLNSGPPTPGTPQHPLTHSLSASLDMFGTDQTVPQDGADITDSMSSSSGSPYSTFKPVELVPTSDSACSMEEATI